MELIIENIKSAEDKKLITELATRLGLKVYPYDIKKENAALARAMKKAEKGKMFSRKEALKYLGDD
jgi:diphthamide synthase (EF-2-diphthine--ammonia ligase)